jgi:hypothetical protein
MLINKKERNNLSFLLNYHYLTGMPEFTGTKVSTGKYL